MAKYLLAFLTFFIFPHSIYSQFVIKGIVTNERNEPIEFMEVQLKNKDSIVTNSDLSNNKGEFVIDAIKGKYNLIFRRLGVIYQTQSINVSENLYIGKINLAENVEKLQEVVITTKKKLIERKADRIVFNVEQSIVSQGVDAIEVLQRTPKIDISKGSIQLIGKSSLGVMINDKLLNLSSADLEAYLKTIRSENISRIEVITIPPAKYDAQGNSGLINIILKKNINLGWKGNVSSTYFQRTYAGFVPAGTLYYSNEKLNFAFNISADTEAKRPTSETNISYKNSFRNSNETRKESSKGLTASMNLNYAINKKNDIGLIYSSNYWDIRQGGLKENKFYQKDDQQLDSIQKSPFYSKNNFEYYALSSYYDLKIDTLGKKMSLSFNLLKKDNKNIRDFSTTNYLGEYLNETSYNAALNNNNSKYNVTSINLDFTLPYTFATIETGSKVTFIENNSVISFFNTNSNIPSFDFLKSNAFTYKENIFSLYISANKEISEKWSAQIGFRLENTNTLGNSVTMNTSQKNNFLNIFPSAYLTYEPNENNSFSIAYSKRIERPGFSEVNPFRVYSDFYTYESGNPFLLPSFTDNIEFSYLFKNNLSFTLYVSKLKDGKDYLTITDDSINSVISRPENYYNQNTVGVDISHTYEPAKWINSFNSLSGYYNNSNSEIVNVTIPNFKGYGAYLSTKNTFILNSNKTTYLLINFFQNFPSTEGFLKSYNRASLDLGLKFMQLNKKLQVSIIGYDLFAQNRNSGIEIYPNYSYSTKIYNDLRNVTISLNYRFGNSKVKTKSKKVENTEATRF